MATVFVVIASILVQNPVQPFLVQHNQKVQALSPDRPDSPLDVGILPGRTAGCANFLNTEQLNCSLEFAAIDTVVIQQQESRRRFIGKGLADLPCRLGRCGISCHIDVYYSPTAVVQYHKDIQLAECNGRHGKKVTGNDLVCVIPEECPPCLRWRFCWPKLVFGNC